MLIDGIEINVDIEEELQEYEWHNATWLTNKLIACSPFRDDTKPSFYVWLEESDKAPAGAWGDSAGIEYEKGGFLSLLSYLRCETPEDTKQYLLEKYGYTNDENIFHIKKLKLENQSITKPTLPFSLLENLTKHNYLQTRGIPQGIQNALKIGYCPSRKAIAIPWFLPDGRLANIKYRRIDSKRFFYTKGGWSISKLLYGIDILIQKDYLKTVVITEAEIDAISCMVCGFPSVAVGGKAWNNYKRDLLIRTNIKTVIIATDNDSAGEHLRREIERSLTGRFTIKHAHIPLPSKDCNDLLLKERLKHTLEHGREASTFNLSLN